VEINTNLKLTELAVDFIKDPADIWWVIGVKGFKVEESYAKPVLRAFFPKEEATPYYSESENTAGKGPNLKEEKENVRLRICRFCQFGYSEQELTYSLTLKMIIKTEKLLQNLGFFYEWLSHGEEHMYEDIQLFKPFMVCYNCYMIFKQV